jgi:hypothetical protein
METNMETKPSMWKGVKKTEKLSVVTLGICILTLAVIVIFRPF